MTSGSASVKFPFTPSQWQELEHQALIYKHMVLGIPIPHDLLFAVKRSLDFSPSSMFFPYNQTSPSLGWNPYHMGYGKKLDPEPGRCRRTDGKKWRCSKEAYPDSKYCERHMHRGKNRSRKPVEILTTHAAGAAALLPPPPNVGNQSTTAISSVTKNSSIANPTTLHSLSSLPPTPLTSSYTSYNTHNFLYPRSSSSRPPGISLSTQDPSTLLLSLESGSLIRDRYLQGVKEETGEHTFLGETNSGTRRCYSSAGSSIDEPWQMNSSFKLGVTGASSLNQQRESHYSSLQDVYPHLELKSEALKQEKQNQQGYAWGTGFNCELSIRAEREEPQKTIHHFFDEWPPKGSRDSWNDSSSTTQLSISAPAPSPHDFFMSNNSRTP